MTKCYFLNRKVQLQKEKFRAVFNFKVCPATYDCLTVRLLLTRPPDKMFHEIVEVNNSFAKKYPYNQAVHYKGNGFVVIKWVIC